MRKYKFRAWSRKWNIMVYPDTKGYFLDIGNNDVSHIWKDAADDEGVPVMEFIGFADKNNVDIYEDDYVKFTEGNDTWIFRLVWVPTKACFSLSSPNRFMDVMASVHQGHVTVTYSDRFEVIGNVYENPELEDMLTNLFNK